MANPARRVAPAVLVAVLAAVVAGGWVTRFGSRWPSVYVMTGESMEPAIAAHRYFLAWSPVEHLGRGDLVLFRYEDADGVFTVLRRLVGLPGDTVRMLDGQVVVNGRREPWPYRVLEPRARRSELALEGDLLTWGPWTVPPDSVVLLADTRDMIGWPDSRFLGFVPVGDLVARATRTVDGRRLR